MAGGQPHNPWDRCNRFVLPSKEKRRGKMPEPRDTTWKATDDSQAAIRSSATYEHACRDAGPVACPPAGKRHESGPGRSGVRSAGPLLRETELFDFVFAESFDCVRLLDAEGRVLRINAAGLRMLELDSATEIEGQTLERFFTPEARLAMEDIWRQLRQGTSVHTTFPVVTAGGRRRWVESRMRPLFDANGGFFGVLALSRDRTAERRAAELQSGEARILKMIAERAPLAETLEALVRTVEQLSGGMRASVLLLDETGQRLQVAAAPNLPDEYNALVDGVAIGPRVGSCGTAAYRKRCVIVRDVLSDPLWADYRDLARRFGFRACWSEPIFADCRRVLGTFALYYDEPREPSPFETELIHRAAFLAGIAIQQSRLVQEQQRQHEQLAHVSRLNLVGELVANIAHEINQPLYAIANFANACGNLLERPQPDLGRIADWLAKIQRQANRANEIIHRLKRFVRRQTIERVPLRVAQVLADTLTWAGPLAEQHGVRLIVDRVPDEWVVLGDAVHLQQTLTNLIQNAVRALVDAGTERPEVRVRCRSEGTSIVIDVVDNGPGVPPERRAAIFEPFYSTRADGLGLGLPLSRSIIEHHGGRLELLDDTSSGCCFRIALPREASRSPEEREGKEAAV
ncbi:MAG: GAF domain-containing protein [Planctomycetota bacterium]|nr:MAG: GAF domain-containing protein [Planctomycetota bacterium]